MPELRECLASGLILLWFLQRGQRDNWDLKVLKLWADLTDEESAKHQSDGNVVCLTPSSKFKRGNQGHQYPLYPPQLKALSSSPILPVEGLELKNVTPTPRAVILDLGLLSLRVAYLTHTSVQIYSRKAWDEVITKTPVPGAGGQKRKSTDKIKRGRIGLALEFEKYIIAFVTQDLVFEPRWVKSTAELPAEPADAYADYNQFLKGVVQFMAARWHKPRDGLAADVIRTEGHLVFGGVGVYTVCEVFFDAGLHILLTEQELFSVPSRVARLCEAIWSFTHKSHLKLRALLEPALHNWMLAPSEKQRLDYCSWLHVYAQERVRVPSRMKVLLLEYSDYFETLPKGRERKLNDLQGLHDIFDPYWTRDALAPSDEKPSLAPIIFGPKDTASLFPNESFPDTPLAVFYRTKRLRSGETVSTHLKPNHYVEGLAASGHTAHVYVSTEAFRSRVKGQKQLWSIHPHLPPTTSLTNRGEERTTLYSDFTPSEISKRLFTYIVTKTRNVSIGPLEYCASGDTELTTHRKVIAHPLKAGNATRAEILALQPTPSPKKKKLPRVRVRANAHATSSRHTLDDCDASSGYASEDEGDLLPSMPMTSTLSSGDEEANSHLTSGASISGDDHYMSSAGDDDGSDFLPSIPTTSISTTKRSGWWALQLDDEPDSIWWALEKLDNKESEKEDLPLDIPPSSPSPSAVSSVQPSSDGELEEPLPVPIPQEPIHNPIRRKRRYVGADAAVIASALQDDEERPTIRRRRTATSGQINYAFSARGYPTKTKKA